jgi:hypothetical protein
MSSDPSNNFGGIFFSCQRSEDQGPAGEEVVAGSHVACQRLGSRLIHTGNLCSIVQKSKQDAQSCRDNEFSHHVA